MSEKYKITDPEGTYFITMTIVYWIDLFTRKEFKHIITDNLEYCQKNKGLVIHAWCIMPSHLHLIISSKNKALPDILRDFKKHTNYEIIKLTKNMNESRKEWLLRAFQKAGEKLTRIKHYKVWQDGNHPILLENKKMMMESANYLHNNPVNEEIVDEPQHYRYSSAIDYCGGKGILNVDLLN